MKKLLSLVLASFMFLGLCSCTVNEAKDMQTVILRVDGEDIKKEDFVKLVNYTAVAYKAYNDTDILSDENTAKTFKESIFDEFEDTMIKVAAAKKEGLKIDKKAVKKSADSDYKTLKESLVGKKGTDDQFLKALKPFGFKSIKEFKDTIYTMAERNAYSTKLTDNYTKNKKGDKDTTEFPIMKAGNTEIEAYIYYYYLVDKELSDYLSNGGNMPERSAEEQEAYYDEVAKKVAEESSLVEAGEKEGFKFSAKEIKEKTATTAYAESLFGEKEVYRFAERYGISKKQYQKARDYQATAALTKEKLEENIKKEVKENATDENAKKYYNSNKDRYSTAKVSAKHILIDGDRKDLVDYIKKQIDDDSFDRIFDLYENASDKSEAIKEVADLGAFEYKTMVKEFSDAAFKAKVGKMVGPVETEFGYHLIYVYDKKDGEVKSFEDVKKDAKEDYIEDETRKRIEKEVTSITEKPKYKILNKDGVKLPFEVYLENFKKSFKIKAYKKKAIR